MVDNFEAVIGASIRGFQARMAEVDAAVRDAASGADVEIGADISEFMSEISAVQSTLEAAIRESDVPIGADISEFISEIALIQTVLADLVREHDIDLDADTGEADRGLAALWLRIRALTMNDFTVRIRSSWSNYQQVMGAMATFSRNFGEIVGMTARGITIAMSPAIVPVLASVVGLLGNLGPMLGAIAGSTFALGSAFGTAGIGAAAFGAIAVSNLKDIFGASSELKKLQEKLADTTDLEERNKIMEEMTKVQSGLNDEQRAGLDAMNKLKSTWSDIAGSFESQTIEIFTAALGIMSGVLTDLKPMFTGVMDAAEGLIGSLGKAVNAKPMQDFFNYLNTTAGPMLSTITEAVGNFFQGFFSMMTAFGPLATETAGGFLKMSEGFAAWAAGLSESKKFQAFVDYVSENMPKIRSIFSDAIQGIINMFAGFGGSSSDMMTSLQNLMERFKTFSSTISENKGFQNFIDYIKTNGPVVVSVIGQLVTFIVNMGIAAAPMGAMMLAAGQAILGFANGLLAAHPWLGKIAVGAVVLGGAFLALMPTLVGINSLTGGFITTLLRMAATWTIAAMRMAAGWIVAMGPIGWVIIAVAALAALIYVYWDEISAFTKKAWTAVSTAVTNAVDKIMSWIQTKFPAIYTVIQSYMSMVKEVISAAWDYIKGTFSNVLSFLKALVKGDFAGMKAAVQSQMELIKSTISRIWNAVKSYISTVLSTILSVVTAKFASIVSSVSAKMDSAKAKISAKWEEAKSATSSKLASLVSAVTTFFSQVVSRVREKMSEAVRTLGQKVGEMPGKVRSYVGKMLSAGSDLVSGLINGIKNMGSAAIDAISGVIGGVVGKAKSLLKIKSPSRVFMEMGAYVSEGLANGVSDKAKLAVDNVARMASQMTSAFNPQLAMADMRASAQLDTSMNRADMGVVRKSFAAEIDSGEKSEQAIYVTNEIVGDKILTMVNRGQAKQSRLTDGFYGK